MTIDEAIERLNSQLARYRGYELPADKAIQLGIEALERIKEMRNRKCPYSDRGLADGIRTEAFLDFRHKAKKLLPSETE